jgi:hypothetical protein
MLQKATKKQELLEAIKSKSIATSTSKISIKDYSTFNTIKKEDQKLVLDRNIYSLVYITILDYTQNFPECEEVQKKGWIKENKCENENVLKKQLGQYFSWAILALLS